MRIENRSVLYPTHRLQKIVDYAVKHCPQADTAVLQVSDNADLRRACGGYAYRDRVEMTMGAHAYPCHVAAHVEEVGPVDFYSFEEEFLFVLAHETCHILQIRSGRFFASEYAAEVEAELHAVKVLGAYRRSLRKKNQATSTKDSLQAL